MSFNSSSRRSCLQSSEVLSNEALYLLGSVVDALKQGKERRVDDLEMQVIWQNIAKENPRYEFFLSETSESLKCPVEDWFEAGKVGGRFNVLKSMKSILDSISSSITEKVEELDDHVRTLTTEFYAQGLASLPDEVLSIVIQFAAVPHVPGQQALALSHVSTRFRRLAIGSPIIWSHISHEYHNFELSLLYAQRSRGAGLHVSTCDLFGPTTSKKLLEATIPFCSEWRSFSYSGYYEPTHPTSSLRAHRLPLQLPMLEHLEVVQDDYGVWKSYFMPNLRSAHFMNSVPTTTPFMPTSLTTFKMSFDSTSPKSRDPFGRLLKFLDSSPSIKVLSIDLGDCLFAYEGLSVVCLHSVEEFTFAVKLANRDITAYEEQGDDEYDFDFDSEDGDGDENGEGEGSGANEEKEEDIFQEQVAPIIDLIASLNMPNLKTMTLSVSLGRIFQEDAPWAMFAFLPDPNSHPCLTSLNVTVKDERQKYSERVLEFPVYATPHLTHLTLSSDLGIVFECEVADSEGTAVRCEPFPLQHLELVDCPKLTNRFLVDVFLVTKFDYQILKKVVVRSCPHLDVDMELWAAIVGDGKIRFAPSIIDEDDLLGAQFAFGYKLGRPFGNPDIILRS